MNFYTNEQAVACLNKLIRASESDDIYIKNKISKFNKIETELGRKIRNKLISCQGNCLENKGLPYILACEFISKNVEALNSLDWDY